MFIWGISLVYIPVHYVVRKERGVGERTVIKDSGSGDTGNIEWALFLRSC